MLLEREEDRLREDLSDTVIQDDVIQLLHSCLNRVKTAPQAIITSHALQNNANTTLAKIADFAAGHF